jgi:multiple antibiotic resistance protein
MSEFMHDLIHQFVTLWAVIDPIGSIPVFLAVTAGFPITQQRKFAAVAILTSAGVLLFFIVAGQLLLESMDIPLPAFQIAGGIVLFLFALTMIFGEGKPEEEKHLLDQGKQGKQGQQGQDKPVSTAVNHAIFPLAIPSIASPGAMMAVVMLTDNHRFDLVEQSLTAGLMLLVIVITLLLLLGATFIHRLIGDAGASIISRVMGLILGAVATSSVLEGIATYFSLAV